MINITEVRIKKLDIKGTLVASADITLDEVFVVHGIDIMNSGNGLYIKMPDRKLSNGGYKDIAHPITSECRQYIKDTVINAYEKM